MEAPGHFAYLGQFTGHGGWVTSIATPQDGADTILSASRDKTIIYWNVNRDGSGEVTGTPKRSLVGHSNFVQDVVISSDGQFALSGGWDGTLRLWELATGKTSRRFVGHSKDVMGVAFSPDNRQIVSGARDNQLKVWNTLGECKYSIAAENDGHKDWVSCVRFSPNQSNPLIVSAGWDKTVKVWTLAQLKLQTNLCGHSGYVNSVAVSPDGSLCASGGKDGVAMLWDLNRGEHLYDLEANEVIHNLTFSPNRYWLCAATENCIKIWDLESKSVVAELVPAYETAHRSKKYMKPECISLQWSADGSTLYSGYTDNTIRVWGVSA